MQKKNNIHSFNSSHVIVGSFLMTILIGTILLSLPITTQNGESVGVLNALFTATSAICVTGLTVLNTMATWNTLGKIIILLLIQIGSLGFMTLVTLILVFLGRKITLKDRILIQDSFNLFNFKGVVSFIKKIVLGTLIVEIIGAIFLSFEFIPKFGFIKGFFVSIFHSISAFCNAGFDILGESSLMDYSTNYLVNITLMFLIVLGGLGFTVWLDLLELIKSIINKKKCSKNLFLKISLHTKLTLLISFILIIIGWIVVFVLEYTNKKTIGAFCLDEKLLASLFQSVTLRTAGFDALGQANLFDGTKFFSMLLMIIGGSPGGTAGGIKTVTVGVVVLAALSLIRGSDSINIFKKSISFTTVQKALSIIILFIFFVFSATIVLSISEANSGYEFLDLLYEVISAIATVGLSTGITPYLTTIGKITIIICMFIGRIGPITVALALSFNKSSNKNNIHYPKDRILVG